MLINPVVIERDEHTEADPLSADELYRLLHTPSGIIQELNYAEFACFSGISVSEGFALAWEDIDWDNKSMRIERACVLGEYKRPKTEKRRRTLKLFDQALEVLQRQRELTFTLPGTEIKITEKRNKRTSTEILHFIFLKTSTGKPHTDSKEIHKLWKKHLREAGLRHRGINQCRHTFASRLLTTGKYPEKWIANYLGHTTTAMLHKHYGKFIETDAPDLEAKASEDLRLTAPSAKTKNNQENTNKEKDDFNPIVTQKSATEGKFLKN